MGDQVCFLISILYEGTLLKCALKVSSDALPGDCAEYPMEPENREILHGLLPLHVRECGPIVNVEPIFEVIVIKGK